MIINLQPTGWECIYQQAHALLAAQIGAHWRPDLRPVPTRWVETMAALAQHDDAQDPWTGTHGLTPAGAPAPFKLVPFSRTQAQRVCAQARFQGRWRWLLTSMHLSNLYEPLRGEHGAKTDAFLDEQRTLQVTCRKGLGVTKKAAEAAYDLLQLCDRFSLILCLHELPDDERRLEIGRGPDGRTYHCYRPGVGAGGDLTASEAPIPVVIEPWPFAEATFEVSVEASILTQLVFQNDAELAEALRTAKIEERRWVIGKE
jgi:hypothetical protein